MVKLNVYDGLYNDVKEMVGVLAHFQAVQHQKGALSRTECSKRNEFIESLSPELKEIAERYVEVGRNAQLYLVGEDVCIYDYPEDLSFCDEDVWPKPVAVYKLLPY